MTVDDFAARAGAYFAEHAFYGAEIARRVEAFGAIAHVFSTYEARHQPDDPAPFARGINSLQLFTNGERWWIASLIWDEEQPDAPIPDKYLPAKE